jgi:hypothetical protein
MMKNSPEASKKDWIKFGNKSKTAINWMGGPIHEFKEQHIPGYKGHVPNIASENVFGKTYAMATADSIGKNI